MMKPQDGLFMLLLFALEMMAGSLDDRQLFWAVYPVLEMDNIPRQWWFAVWSVITDPKPLMILFIDTDTDSFVLMRTPDIHST